MGVLGEFIMPQIYVDAWLAERAAQMRGLALMLRQVEDAEVGCTEALMECYA